MFYDSVSVTLSLSLSLSLADHVSSLLLASFSTPFSLSHFLTLFSFFFFFFFFFLFAFSVLIVFDQMHLESHQKLNHFRNGKEICRKDLLVKNLKKRRRQLEKEGSHEEATNYDFFPVTFNLPREYALFVEEFKRQGGLWIMKPIGSAQGKGIFLFSKLSEISEWRSDYRYKPGPGQQSAKEAEAYVVQRYINNPYLVGGKKFDLRL